MRSLFRTLFLAALVTAGANAWAFTANPLYQDTIGSQINLGNGSLFTVSSYGDLNALDNTITGPSKVVGNIAIGGSGNFSMSDGDIYGDLYVHAGAKVAFSGPATLHGTQHNNADAVINPALQDYWSLSAKAGMEAGTNNWSYNPGSAAFTWNAGTATGTVNGNKNYSIFSTGKTILNLQDFVLTGGSFTLSGTATTTYIINVARNFSLNNSFVSLSGISSSQVLFNILGTGGQVSLNQGTSLGGILLAVQRKVDLSGGKVFGRVIGNQVNITSGGQVVSQ